MTQTVEPELAYASVEVPNKRYFKIGEVVSLVGVHAHVLRYWEKEVPGIRPSKSGSNQRRYRKKDVETFLTLRRLLHDEKYTLAGAKQWLLRGGSTSVVATAAVAPQKPSFARLRLLLLDLLEICEP